MGKEAWERPPLDDAARRRLVRACEAGVSASALEERFGTDASQLRRMARAAGWDGVARRDSAYAPMPGATGHIYSGEWGNR